MANKYARPILDLSGNNGITVDVYAVLDAFAVTCPARQHAIKKLLCAGLRGGKDELQDIEEAGLSIVRAVDMCRAKLCGGNVLNRRGKRRR